MDFANIKMKQSPKNNDFEKAADYVEKFFGPAYGSIAATLLEGNPLKYASKINKIDGNIEGVLCFYKDFDSANIKILAGNYESLESFVHELKNKYGVVKIKVLESMVDYIPVLKKMGFEEKSRFMAKEYDENIIKMVK